MVKKTSRSQPLDKIIMGAIKRYCVLHQVEVADKEAVMKMAGSYSKGSKQNSLRKLKKEGNVVMPTPKTLRLTAQGDAKVGIIELPTNADNLADIKSRVTGKAKNLVDILSDGDSHSREEMEAELGNLAKGSKANTLRQVRQLAETEEFQADGTTMFRFEDFAFPEGRPATE